MKRVMLGLAVTCMGAVFAENLTQTIAIDNVALRQDRGTQKVYVTYDLANDGDEPAFVVLDILTNGVSIGRANIQTVSGDVSDGDLSQTVTVGTGKQIVWDARRDWKGHLSSNTTARVTAYYAGHLNQIPGVYMKIDLSGGSSAASYPVSYSLAGPNMSDTASYTKNALWLRRCEPGVFIMGSPASEIGHNTSGHEDQHQVTLNNAFFLSVFEVTEGQYKQVMGTCPSSNGDTRPAVKCGYNTLRGTTYSWPQSSEVDENTFFYKLRARTSLTDADLPTEAQWEYACRAGTETPFNTIHSTGPDEANYYGHYPYEIEENYFDDSVLETRPGQYRQKTVEVTSFSPNPWGLYNMHGNVNEWCWDLYGAYDLSSTTDPTGAETGTRRVYRGGGWNDFGKNLRSAYRAAGELNMVSYNLGIRLVRSQSNALSGTVTTTGEKEVVHAGGKMLIAYFSWSGNTQGIAEEIQRQTGADLFEIVPVPAYSDDYNTVLMEAQRDQHNQARPAISNPPADIDAYDVILLGYPNWWASIPMPIAAFLESYDFSGKTILPF